jgi:hypothetical protein
MIREEKEREEEHIEYKDEDMIQRLIIELRRNLIESICFRNI